jgi:enoyl-CoA hydratase/carnithine racemase
VISRRWYDSLVRDTDPISSVTQPDGSHSPTSRDPLVVIDLDDDHGHHRAHDATRPALVVGHSTTTSARDLEGVDIALTTCEPEAHPWILVDDLENALSAIRTAVQHNPMASIVAAQVMRVSEGLVAQRALVVESIAYGMLQDGPEHHGWLANSRPRASIMNEDGPDVTIERADDVLTLSFNRPRQRNAYRARTREELVAGLELALLDESIVEVHLRGEGSSFSSGGDLNEFGTVENGATGHLIRTTHNAVSLLERLGERTTAFVHGPCYGAGVELSAACSTVIASPDTTFTLPEVAMGLIPGAGGTWSVPRRIGRHRATWLAVTGASIDVARALAWGLVDEERRDHDVPS